MNKKTYYKLIKEYNQLINEKNFNTDFFSKEKQDRLEDINNLLLLQVKKIDALATTEPISTSESALVRRERINKLRSMIGRLEEQRSLEEMLYVNSWFELLWFGLFTSQQVLVILAVILSIFVIKTLLG